MNHAAQLLHLRRRLGCAADPARALPASTRLRTAAPRRRSRRSTATTRATRCSAPLAIYHWTPDIPDFNDPQPAARLAAGGPGRPRTRTTRACATRCARSYGYWIREAGVDGFRVDTAFYVPPEYFLDFLHADDAKAPGIAARGRADRPQASSTCSAKASASTSRSRTTQARAHRRATCAMRRARACHAGHDQLPAVRQQRRRVRARRAHGASWAIASSGRCRCTPSRT